MPPINRYPVNHWLRDPDPDKGLAAYFEQQGLAYSRVKNGYVRELLGDLEGKKFLDYGCGAGLFLIYAAKRGARTIVGVDAEQTVLNAAGRFAARTGYAGKVLLVRGHEFPSFKDRTKFDVILIKDVMEHVPNDLVLLEACAEVMVPGGRLVISTQNALSLNYLIQGTWNRLVLSNKDWCGWDPTHLRFYRPDRLKRLLSRAGFVCRGWRSVYLIPYKWPAPRGYGRDYIRFDALSGVDRAIGGRYPFNRFGWNLIVQAVYQGKS